MHTLIQNTFWPTKNELWGAYWAFDGIAGEALHASGAAEIEGC